MALVYVMSLRVPTCGRDAAILFRLSSRAKSRNPVFFCLNSFTLPGGLTNKIHVLYSSTLRSKLRVGAETAGETQMMGLRRIRWRSLFRPIAEHLQNAPDQADRGRTSPPHACGETADGARDNDASRPAGKTQRYAAGAKAASAVERRKS
jgi:hypothetical protein